MRSDGPAKSLPPVLDPSVGQTVSTVVDRFGPPSSHYASSALATTYQWDSFGAGQMGMAGCRVLVEAKRSYDDPKALAAYGDDTIQPEQYWKWTITNWSSFGSGCK